MPVGDHVNPNVPLPPAAATAAERRSALELATQLAIARVHAGESLADDDVVGTAETFDAYLGGRRPEGDAASPDDPGFVVP